MRFRVSRAGMAVALAAGVLRPGMDVVGARTRSHGTMKCAGALGAALLSRQTFLVKTFLLQ